MCLLSHNKRESEVPHRMVLERDDDLCFGFSTFGNQIPMISTETGLLCRLPTMSSGIPHCIVRELRTLPSDGTVTRHFVAAGSQELLFVIGRVGTQGLPVPIASDEFQNNRFHHTSPELYERFRQPFKG